MKSKEEIMYEEVGHHDDFRCAHASLETCILNAMSAFADQDRWVSVEDGLPEHEINVIAYTDYEYIICYYSAIDCKWYDSRVDDIVLGITHWQPLPKAPGA